MRTNIEIDDELMRAAMAASNKNTKRAAVEEALRLMVAIKGQAAVRELWGTVTWCGPEDDWFAPDPLDPGWAEEMARRGISRPIASDSLGQHKVEAQADLVAGHGMTGTHGYR